MANSKVQTLAQVGLERTASLSCGSTCEEEEVATQSPRSTANSSSVETPWSSLKSGTASQDLHDSVGEDGDSDSCTEGVASESQERHDDYYAFLRDFAGSFEDDNVEKDLESDPGSLDGTGDEEQVPIEAEHRKISIISAEDDNFEDSDAESDSDGKPSLHTRPLEDSSTSARDSDGKPSLHTRPLEDSSTSARGHSTSCGDHPSPDEDDYDVVKAVQHYASQRPGNRMQHWWEDMQAAARVKREQAYRLGVVAKKQHTSPHIRMHYAKMRVELLTQVKTIEMRLYQVARDAQGSKC